MELFTFFNKQDIVFRNFVSVPTRKAAKQRLKLELRNTERRSEENVRNTEALLKMSFFTLNVKIKFQLIFRKNTTFQRPINRSISISMQPSSNPKPFCSSAFYDK